MDAFWQFVNKRSVRLALAAFCFFLAVQGGYRIYLAQTNLDIFRGAGDLVLWLSWALVNYLRANGKVAPKLNIAVNVGIAMLVISWFMGK